jgi:hypothetical protein
MVMCCVSELASNAYLWAVGLLLTTCGTFRLRCLPLSLFHQKCKLGHLSCDIKQHDRGFFTNALPGAKVQINALQMNSINKYPLSKPFL